MDERDVDLQDMSKAIMKTYQEKMHEYLNSKPQGTLTDANVILMIMNLTIGIATNIYYTLKQILPGIQMDFDYMKAKMGNEIFAAFEKIKDYNPKDTMMVLTVEQVKEIQEKGFAVIPMPNGGARRVTVDELMVKKEDASKLIVDAKKKSINMPNSKKIVVPSNR